MLKFKLFNAPVKINSSIIFLIERAYYNTSEINFYNR